MTAPLRLSDFDFVLPEAQIAQSPAARRDASRLLAVNRWSGGLFHRGFAELPSLLRERDLLVVNDTRVVPARLIGQKEGTGGRVELLVVRPAASTGAALALGARVDSLDWLCIGQASKGLKPGVRASFAAGLRAEVLESLGGGEVRVRFESEAAQSLSEALAAAGRLPLPPYIEREPEGADAERYQTIYARAAGSVAAPTAGLHFTPEIFAALEARGVKRASVTLDVGPGTFLPVREDDLDLHRMHPERFDVPEETAEAIAQTRAVGGRVIAVGTTVVRTLESATEAESGAVRSGPGETRMFIRPGYVFRQVDALLTNFHLPKSTLVMLVSAFLGRERTLAAYAEAVERGYRFFSYGDAMFIAEDVT